MKEANIERLGRLQAGLFQNDHLTYMELLVKADITRHIMIYAYRWLVENKKLDLIESLPEDKKVNLWETAKEFAKDRLTKAKMIELSKALFTLEYFLNL